MLVLGGEGVVVHLVATGLVDGDGVHTDARAGQADAEALRERVHSALEGRVDRDVRGGAAALDGGEVHDAPPAPLPHAGDERLAGPEPETPAECRDWKEGGRPCRTLWSPI